MEFRRPTQSCGRIAPQDHANKNVSARIAGRDAGGGAVAAFQGSGADPRTAAWLSKLPQSKGAPPARSNSPGPRPPSKRSRLDFLYDLRRIARLPASRGACPRTTAARNALHRERPGVHRLSAGRSRAACNAHQSDGTLVFYQPSADYHGADSITLSVTSSVSRHSQAALCDRREVTAPSAAEDFHPAGIVSRQAGAAALAGDLSRPVHTLLATRRALR